MVGAMDVELKPVYRNHPRSRLWAGSNGKIYELLRDGSFKAYRTLIRPDSNYWDKKAAFICDRVPMVRKGVRTHFVKYRKVATLVLDAFKQKLGGCSYDLYKDGNPANNVPSNLYRGSYTERELDNLYHQENGVGNVRPEILER